MKPNFADVNTFICKALKLEVEATRNTNFEKSSITPLFEFLRTSQSAAAIFMSNPVEEIVAD